jgi:hypothetical protein
MAFLFEKLMLIPDAPIQFKRKRYKKEKLIEIEREREAVTSSLQNA